MKKPTTFSKKTLLLLSFIMISIGMVGQTLNQPEPIANPNFGSGGDPWTAICASSTFNEYFVNFTWSPTPSVDSDNSFILELSDADGNFNSPTTLATVTDKNSTTDFDIEFAIPITTRGDNYKLRVKSTNPELYSPETDAFEMYYIDYKNPISITEDGSGTIGDGTISICDGNSAVIEVDNVPDADTYQYIWRRSSTILSETSYSITVSEAGSYTAEIDYGLTCSGSAGTLSNMITVETGTALGVTINEPTTTTFCEGETADPLEATIAEADLYYTWYKDDVEVEARTQGAYAYTIDTNTADFSGDYTVKVDGDGVCTETTPALTISKTGEFTVTVVNELEMVILPGNTEILSVTTTATSPTYQWYKDDIAITGETSSSLAISEEGEYYVELTETGACTTSQNSEKTSVVAPVSFEIVIDYTNSYEDCINTSVLLGVSNIYAIAEDGSETDVTTDLMDNLTYQWKKDNTDISGSTGSSISLADNSENGSYTLDASIESFSAISNSLDVVLKNNLLVEIEASSLIACNSSEAITISTTTDLSSETYTWYKDGSDLGISTTELSITETGVYQLVLIKDGCPILSNEVTIEALDESLITLDDALNVVIIEGSTKTITASGGTAYQWRDSDNNIISASTSATFTEEGTYFLTAYIDDCAVIKEITVSYKDTFKIPNVITVNGDGINDLWVIPNSYSNQEDITVTIYNENGQVIINTNNYQNNWPESSTSFPSQNMIFYYKINEGSDIIKQGTITVIK
ncbi:gliding motility-associated C-terminal domain-containing protein [Cellulophaga baltica]|uniref:T9SS type B sorting domain-containing protein n=1 Tax=Cellulophaga TaxID=104264 RepID=UPI001C06A597|nr:MULTISPECIES: gliding motility-associated C-terminal domain-containing protein [Cellulophaga]MBU2995901.1 gliding motility-associated C-terminal domain-containing protein [Cellulophaga baltica]MDO6767296.1 gliding motility-associated C-terminal domain-containing protein [Cellulophaga sp. 1_MG-2023]